MIINRKGLALCTYIPYRYMSEGGSRSLLFYGNPMLETENQWISQVNKL
jgi:hypothetical protein